MLVLGLVLALGLTMKATATPLELSSRAVACTTDDGNGTCLKDGATCSGTLVDDGCSDGFSCCLPPDPAQAKADDDADDAGGDEGVGPDDGDHIPDPDDDKEISERSADPLRLFARKDSCGVRVYKKALSQRGVPYVRGGGDCNGKTHGGFDCSGLTLYAVCQATYKKVKLPHKAWRQYASPKCKHVKYEHRQKGDLVFWSTRANGKCTKDESIHHVAVVQDHKYIVAAPKKGDVVKRQKMWSGYGGLYKCNYVARCC